MPKIFSEISPGCKRITLHGPTMGTRWSASVDAHAGVDPGALRQGLATAVQLVDQQMSPWKHDSDLMRLNRAPVETWVDLPAELLEVMNCALDIHRLSAGAFDPGVGALVDAWGFGAVRDVPDAAAIHAARQEERPNTQALTLDRPGGRARKTARLQLDLCGIAKGYAVDLMVAVLKQHGVEHALVALDGELRAVGSQADGEPWAVALERPEVAHRAVHGVIELQDLAVATSGDYRRSFQLGALRLAHTMDARRAAPVNNAVASVDGSGHVTALLGHRAASRRPQRRFGHGTAYGTGRAVSAAPCRRLGGNGAGTVWKGYRAI